MKATAKTLSLFSCFLGLMLSSSASAHLPCEHGNIPEFYLFATKQDIMNCAKSGIDTSKSDDYGQTVLHWAAFYSENPGVIVELAKAGAGPNARDELGQTPLHIAAYSSAPPAIITKLAEVGANPDARDKDGITPLHLAAEHTTKPAVVIALLDAGADPTAKTTTGFGKTPWDYIKKNPDLKETEAYWRLHEARFK